jgi:hypothetical protein
MHNSKDEGKDRCEASLVSAKLFSRKAVFKKEEKKRRAFDSV